MSDWDETYGPPAKGTLERLADALERMVEIMEQHIPEEEEE